MNMFNNIKCFCFCAVQMDKSWGQDIWTGSYECAIMMNIKLKSKYNFAVGIGAVKTIASIIKMEVVPVYSREMWYILAKTEFSYRIKRITLEKKVVKGLDVEAIELETQELLRRLAKGPEQIKAEGWNSTLELQISLERAQLQ